MKFPWTKKVEEKPNWFTSGKHDLKEAFCVGGKTYYEFGNVKDMPFARAQNFLLVFEEMSMRCTAEFLKEHVEAVRKLMTGNSIGSDKFIAVHKLNEQLNERLTYAPSSDAIYKVCAVFFVGEDEKPWEYDPDKTAAKIAHWKKHESVTAFFLNEPIQRLIPYLQDSDMSSQIYSGAIDEVHKAQSEFLSSIK